MARVNGGSNYDSLKVLCQAFSGTVMVEQHVKVHGAFSGTVIYISLMHMKIVVSCTSASPTFI